MGAPVFVSYLSKDRSVVETSTTLLREFNMQQSTNLFGRQHSVERLSCPLSAAGGAKAVPEMSTGEIGSTTRRGAGLVDSGERSRSGSALNPGVG